MNTDNPKTLKNELSSIIGKSEKTVKRCLNSLIGKNISLLVLINMAIGK